jgi:hypothetical protein
VSTILRYAGADVFVEYNLARGWYYWLDDGFGPSGWWSSRDACVAGMLADYQENVKEKKVTRR